MVEFINNLIVWKMCDLWLPLDFLLSSLKIASNNTKGIMRYLPPYLTKKNTWAYETSYTPNKANTDCEY